MFKTIIRTTACLAVSAAAFIVITKMDASAAKSKSSAPEQEEAAPPATSGSTSTPRKPKQPPPKLEMASLKMPATTAPAAAATTATDKTGLDSTLTVPDWKGKRLSAARREARKLGFNVVAIDEEGEKVPAREGANYRVRRQLTASGTSLEPGATVELRVREAFDAPSGY